jgi:hypothetical protein
LGVISLAAAIGICAAVTAWYFPRAGTKPLVHTGGLLILLIIATEVMGSYHQEPVLDQDRVVIAVAVQERQREILRKIEEKVRKSTPLSPEEQRELNETASLKLVTDAALLRGPIWPVFIAGAAFLYIWWLAIVTFDLTFVWHMYIRHSAAQRFLEQQVKEAKAIEVAGRA